MSAAHQREADAGPDLSVCEQEPIHIPGSIEPNGVLLVAREPELIINQVSANAGFLVGGSAESLLGLRMAQVIDSKSLAVMQQRIPADNLRRKRCYLSGVYVATSGQTFDASVHRQGGLLLVELEPANEESSEASLADFSASLSDAMADLDGRYSLQELCRRVAIHTRRLTGFDRVMVYQFLADDTGCVVAEDRRRDLSPYLGLRYPASDIPAQARRLYVLNTLRLKADVKAPRVPLLPAVNPSTGQPLDMSYCILRAMSPVHDEYLRNMGVSASMSVSIVKEERLWGLIACHHTSAKTVSYPIRMSCDILARVFSARIAAAEEEDARHDAKNSRDFLEELERRLRAGSEVRNTLIEQGEQLASVIHSQGAAICVGGQIATTGATPPAAGVARLIDWLKETQQDYLFGTDKLADHWAGAEEYPETATGLLSARIALGSSDFILWFRPPAVQVVEWAGNPDKPVEETEAGKRISPRLSFERWKQTIGDRAEPWREHEKDFAVSLRQTVAEVLLIQKNREVIHLNQDLARSNIELEAFAYAASHDLQEPVRTIRAYAQLLMRRNDGRLDEEAPELLALIEGAAARMASLITALLAYAQLGASAGGERASVSLEDVLRWALINVDESLRASGGRVTHDELPAVTADPEQLTQLLQNLIGNSIKYCQAHESPRVHVSAARNGTMWQLGIHDNGQGFAPADSEIIFGAFKRLHGREIPGAGIGLALCRRIVERHGGRIWAESKGKGQGATIWFTLPV